MKKFLKNTYFIIALLFAAGTVFLSCEDDDNASGGSPTIRYIRITDPASSDSLINSAFLGNLIAIVGENLGAVRKLYFNDQEALLTSTFITNENILVRVPNQAPSEITNKMKLVFRDGSELLYDFVVSIPPPTVTSMDLEYVPTGETAVINGFYFFDPVPVQVFFTSADGEDVVEGEVISTQENRLEVVVPEGAGPGPITVKTNFGTASSTFYFRDNRNVFLNYDEAGKTPANAWRNGIMKSDDNNIDGKYLFFQGIYNNGERIEGDGSPYESQFWAKASGRPQGNLLPPGNPADYVMKFETKVVDWYGSTLNICFAPWDHSNNQEIWSNTFNARAIWEPWREKNASYDTDGEWITVTIPITEFKWAMGTQKNPANNIDEVVYTEKAFDPDVTGSLSFWVLSAPEANASPFEFYIDNVRIVAK